MTGGKRLDATVAQEAAQHAGQSSMIAIAVVVAVAALLGLGFIRLRQPPLVGFILAGITLGPTGLGLISSSGNVTVLAEMGVILLLFFIGMELSIKAFVLTLRSALLVAAGQIIAAVGLSSVLAWLTGSSFSEAIILGFIIALSSTVVAMKMLDEMGQLRGEAGRIAVGVLIAQDLAVVPMLIFVSSLGGDSVPLTSIIVKIVIAAGILGGLLWWLGRRPKLRVPYTEAIEHKIEILALGSLAICFAAAAVSGVAGLSPVYGAFIAGIVVGNSTLRSRVVPVIEPIQSVLLVVFFLSIGLLIDLDFIWRNLWEVLSASILVIALKTVLNIFLLRKMGIDRQNALIAGLSMAQIGEFSFVLASAGLSAGALGLNLYRFAIAVTALSLLLSPMWFSVLHRLENMAAEGLKTYRQALAIGYQHELEEVARGRAFVARLAHGSRVRYRALRLALYHRRAEAKNHKTSR
ncbi:cation:proton antiporter [Rhizobium sp. KVB221]|uniref:Cation:proton antiporter n=1 Tax=Rhizobium setariae TaxID=2801340 RepID=A0A937CRG3_9HYPH|nr:cation:proton antiporter [Rhizobium setariae]MBL0374497.1 cation:proton antiporter [Rhizobium setariae]